MAIQDTELHQLPPESDEELSFSDEKEERVLRVIETVQEGDKEKLIDLLPRLYAADLADVLSRIEIETGLLVLNLLEDDLRGETLHELEEESRKNYLARLTVKQIAAIVARQESDEAVHILEVVDSSMRGAILARLPMTERFKIAELLNYPENTAASIMSKDFVYVLEQDTVKEAMRKIRRIARDDVDFYTVYVLDEAGFYKGHVSLKRLMLSNTRTRIQKIAENELLPIPMYLDQEEAAQIFTRYDFITAPVLNEQGMMLGRITADDIMQVIEEEASEDILKLGGVITGDDTMTAPIYESSAKRLTWLSMNLVTAFLAAAVVNYFKDTISQAIVLAALMPIVAGMGGNAAGQTVAFVVRNLALGELNPSNAARAIRREMILGMLNGLFIGILTGTAVYFLTGRGTGLLRAAIFGGIIFLAMFVNMLTAAVAGSAIPLLLKKLRIDPAIASSIFVTTCTDVMGFFVFLGLASIALYLKWL